MRGVFAGMMFVRRFAPHDTPGRGGQRAAPANEIRRVLFLCALLCAHCVAASGPGTPFQLSKSSLPASEWKAIQRVISEQRAALVAGEGAKAFAYASPGIRSQFGDSETFIAMVRGAYAPLISARHVEFLEGAVIEGIVVQPLRLIDSDDTVRVALYTMERQENGTWRIAGCAIAP
jgi:hypothetical protein